MDVRTRTDVVQYTHTRCAIRDEAETDHHWQIDATGLTNAADVAWLATEPLAATVPKADVAKPLRVSLPQGSLQKG